MIFRHVGGVTTDLLDVQISRDGSKNFTLRTCEHMILGQLRMGVRQAKNAPLLMADEEGGYNKMIGLLTKFWASTVYPTCVPSKHLT